MTNELAERIVEKLFGEKGEYVDVTMPNLKYDPWEDSYSSGEPRDIILQTYTRLELYNFLLTVDT